jgi:hypothetical protein
LKKEIPVKPKPEPVLKTKGGVITVTDPRSGMTFKISARDRKLVENADWRVVKNHNKVSVRKYGSYSQIYLGRLIAGARPGDAVMYKNGDASDLRRRNLRICSYNQCTKAKNKPVNNTSGFKGVCRDKGKWRAGIRVNDELIHLGRYADPVAAAEAYNRAAKKYFGEFARPNAIPKGCRK